MKKIFFTTNSLTSVLLLHQQLSNSINIDGQSWKGLIDKNPKITCIQLNKVNEPLPIIRYG